MPLSSRDCRVPCVCTRYVPKGGFLLPVLCILVFRYTHLVLLYMRVAFFYSSVWSRDCNVQHAVQQQYRPSLRIPEIGHGLAFVLIRCVLHFLTSWSLPCDRGLHCSHELMREQQQQLLLLSAVLCPWCLGPRPARGRGQQNIMLTVLCIACS